MSRSANDIHTLIVHGAWTKSGVDVGVDEMRVWHLERGFSDIGYHYVIRRNGEIEVGRPWQQQGAHAMGANRDSLGVCLVGGRADDDRDTEGLDEFEKQEVLWEFNYTEPQMLSLSVLEADLSTDFPIANVIGHRDVPGTTKRCPGFNVAAYFAEQAP